MAKRQIITFKKAGSVWGTWNDALTDLIESVNATTPATDDIIANAQAFATEFQMDEATQEFQEIRTFLNDADYDAYKSNITDREDTVNNELKAMGWEITDTVT